MDVYVLVGSEATRKSTLIRCLTGCYNRNIRDILLENGSSIRVYAVTNTLQAMHVTDEDLVKEAERTHCRAVILAMWPQAHPANPIKYPDALTYLNDFLIDGWRIKKVVVLGDINAAIYKQFDVCHLPNVTKDPVNQSAQKIRQFFQWV